MQWLRFVLGDCNVSGSNPDQCPVSDGGVFSIHRP